MNLYIIRHGETDWNAQHKVMGKVDIELNSNGVQQAIAAKKEVDDIKIDAIISSPLIRAKQTAEILAQELNLEVLIDNRLIERDFGEFEGLHRGDFDFEGFWSYTKNNKYEKAENIRIFFDRIYSFLEEISTKYNDKNVLLVIHGGVSIPIHCYFKGIPDDDNLLAVGLGNCDLVEITN